MGVNKNNVKIHISHLKKNFGKLEVLKDVSTDIYEGEVVVVLGPSGSGKSMMAKQEIGFVALNTNHDIIVVDPEREYGPLIRALGGEVITISASTQDLNISIEELMARLTSTRGVVKAEILAG